MSYEEDELTGAYAQRLAGVTPSNLSEESWIYWLRGFRQFMEAAAKAGLVVTIVAGSAPVPTWEVGDPF